MKMQNFKVLGFLFIAVFASAIARPSVSSEEEGKRLIQTREDGPPEWLSQEEVNTLIRNRVHFMDITGRTFPILKNDGSAAKAIPTAVRFQSVVNAAIPKLSIDRMIDFVTKFSAYTNRYYNSDLGVTSSNWLQTTVSDSIKNNSGYAGKVSVTSFTHSWRQDSVIARIEGSNSSDSEVVILGAHQDSINGVFPVNGVAPGADDNASGSVALLEAFRALLESGFVPKKTIEFQWYAAEEAGLLGSQDIAERYYNTGVKAISMLNFDVVGYYVGKNQVSFLTDNTDATLNQFLRLVVEEYLEFTWTNSLCGYGCSDHASWTRYGVPAASPSEAELLPWMHTNRDTIDYVDFKQVLEFAKLALGYAIEISEPSV